MTKAILSRARQHGADAVIQLGISNARTGGGSMYGASHGTRSVFIRQCKHTRSKSHWFWPQGCNVEERIWVFLSEAYQKIEQIKRVARPAV